MGKMGTGIKEKSSEGLSFEDLTKMLKPLIEKEEGKIAKIKPQVVVEIEYQEIQKSPNYNSGYALRFPRLKRLREDKDAKGCSDLDYVKSLYESQSFV